VRKLFMCLALPAAIGLSLAACGGPVGSCQFTTDAGYDYCEDFLGSEFNSSAAQNSCAGDSGTYSSNSCSAAGTLGTCAIGSGTADDCEYTYTSAGGEAVSSTALQSACGVAGGTFAAARN
jgi:hypothetical protein